MIAAPDRTPLPREFFDRPVLEVAPDLLGRTLVRNTPEGPIELRLTEVEAYDGPNDPGSHAYRSRTARNDVMFGPPGHAYVYFTYGMWHCLNLVCGPEDTASGVLLRAGEITKGADLARKRRLSARYDKELAKGPARLATALDVDRALNGADVCASPDSPLAILAGTPTPRDQVRNGPRTGVAGGGGVHPWRYWTVNDPTVSPYRPHTPRR
ncbi:DNA-3-methyladenine glycosylase [Streptomyces sp. NPDC058297]|uniref:DNA-3-methyladenine glycosylase n=1 Tax=Streptomyces sp. NPDC058297 TaxID=3346433 RepID=UPI0036E1319F